MGSYPSADLLYGIDLGIEDEVGRPDWFTEELEEEHGGPGEVLDHLLKEVEGIGHDTYGNFLSGYTGLALCTRAVHTPAYEAQPIDIKTLTATVDDDKALKEAWAILYPGEDMPEPGWFMVVSYG